MGVIAIGVSGVTLILDDVISRALAGFPALALLNDALILLLSAGLATAVFWIVIGRPVRLLTGVVHRLAEEPNESMSVFFTSPLLEIHQLSSSILALRARLLEDEQKFRERELAEQNMRFDAAINNMRQGLCMFDANRRLIVSNQLYATMYRIPPESIKPGMLLEEIVALRLSHGNEPTVGAAGYLQRRVDLVENLKDDDDIVELQDGRVISILHRPMAGGGWVSTHQDITEQMQAREQQSLLTRVNGRLAAATGQSNDGVVLTDPTQEGNPIVYVNRAFCRLTGHDEIQLLGQPSSVIEADCVDDTIKIRLAESIESRRRYQGLIPTRRQDGTTFLNDLSVSPVAEDSGEVTGFVWMFSDVTAQVEQEHKEAADAARNAQFQKMEALGTLAGGIAHDLNNTLVPVLGLSRLLLDDVAAESPNRRPLEAIVGAAERARDLVRQILDFSRVGSGELQAVNLVHEMKKISTVVRAALPATAVLNFTLDAPKMLVLFEPAKLYQILMNLCVNSFDALPDGMGNITVTLEKDEALGRAHFAIRDDGAGMSKETLDRAFEPFFTTKDVGKGTGLGLSIIHGIITRAGGDVQITSEVGHGATVEIWLPLVKEDQPAAAPLARPELEQMESKA